MAEKEKKEMEILSLYLPAQMEASEIHQLAKEAIAKVAAQSSKDFGKVMAELMPKLKGRADGAEVSSAVRELLT